MKCFSVGHCAQIGAHFPDQLQQAVVGVRRQHGQILAATQLGQQAVQIVDLRRVEARPFERRRFDFRRRPVWSGPLIWRNTASICRSQAAICRW